MNQMKVRKKLSTVSEDKVQSHKSVATNLNSTVECCFFDTHLLTLIFITINSIVYCYIIVSSLFIQALCPLLLGDFLSHSLLLHLLFFTHV